MINFEHLSEHLGVLPVETHPQANDTPAPIDNIQEASRETHFTHVQLSQQLGVLTVNAPPQTIDVHASINSILGALHATQLAHEHLHSSGHVVALKYNNPQIETPSHIMIPGHGGDGGYSDYSSDFGWWDSGGGVDFGGSNSSSDGPEPSASDAPEQVHLTPSASKTDGSNGTVNVYYAGNTSDNKNGDQLVTQNLKNVTNEILTATPGVNFVNVSATTNGVHDTISDHYSGNAVDINQINGVAIRLPEGKTAALQLEAQALADVNTRYVEGPGGNWARSGEGGQWHRSGDLPHMDNHVHWSTFRR